MNDDSQEVRQLLLLSMLTSSIRYRAQIYLLLKTDLAFRWQIINLFPILLFCALPYPILVASIQGLQAW
jgi:hypothetical protein